MSLSYSKIVLTIIVPVYNVEKYVARCIESLLSQDFNYTYKIILIDDGSKDNSLSICAKYANANPDKIELYSKPNGGQSSARNFGLDKTQSDYVLFIDSDDWIDKNYISCLYDTIITYSSDISICNIVQSTESKSYSFYTGFRESLTTTDIDWAIRQFSFSAVNKLYKTSLFENLRFPVGIHYEDMALVPQLMYNCNKISYTPNTTYHYYINPTSTINSKLKSVDWDILQAMKILETSKLNGNNGLLENICIRRVLLSFMISLLINVPNSITDAQHVIKDIINKYPHIKQNPLISKLRFHKKIFIILLLSENIKTARLWLLLKDYPRRFIKILIRK